MHLVAVEFPVRRGAEMVFHIARPVDILGFEAAALKLVEDRPIGLGHHIGQHAEAAPVRPADDNVAHAEIAAALDDLFHCRDQRLAAVKAETLGAHIFDMQELLKTLGLHQLVQDRLAPLAGEGDLLAEALDPFLEPARLHRVGDMHVLQREGAAIGAFHDGEDLAPWRHVRGREPCR